MRRERGRIPVSGFVRVLGRDPPRHCAAVRTGNGRSRSGRGGPGQYRHAPAKSGGELEEIVVTAEKRESTVQATAISLTALSAGDLAQQNIEMPEDLVGKIPGISLRTSGPGQTEYEARGLSAGGGAAATVGFYLDETPISASAIALNGRTVIDADLFDLNNVEVLRGPQGTLYGSGSMGGTIKLVTNQPKLGAFDAATDTTVSETSGQGRTNGSGSLMLEHTDRRYRGIAHGHHRKIHQRLDRSYRRSAR